MSQDLIVGADEDDEILDMLGVSGEDDDDDDDFDDVSGEDLVGAGLISPKLMRRLRAAKRRRRPKRKPRALVRYSKAQVARLMKQKLRAPQQMALARAGRLPQIPLGVPATAIATTVTATITVTPTVPIRITDFFIDANVAPAVAIISMWMGRINLLASADPVPGTWFDPTAGLQRAPLEVRKVAAGSPIFIQVNNFSLANITFRAVFQVIDLSTQVYV